MADKNALEQERNKLRDALEVAPTKGEAARIQARINEINTEIGPPLDQTREEDLKRRLRVAMDEIKTATNSSEKARLENAAQVLHGKIHALSEENQAQDD